VLKAALSADGLETTENIRRINLAASPPPQSTGSQQQKKLLAVVEAFVERGKADVAKVPNEQRGHRPVLPADPQPRGLGGGRLPSRRPAGGAHGMTRAAARLSTTFTPSSAPPRAMTTARSCCGSTTPRRRTTSDPGVS
jgi:hypothetical protein